MIVDVRSGELFQCFQRGDFDGLIHGCNCFNSMAAGFAKHVRSLYPIAREADDLTSHGDRSKLGEYSCAETTDGLIINLYTQFEGGPAFNIDAYIKGIQNINDDFPGKHFCMPKIGCGIGGANWDEVMRVTNENTPDITITVFDFTPVKQSLY